jgi:thimet oligopeptidase
VRAADRPEHTVDFARTAEEVTALTDAAITEADALLDAVVDAADRTWASTLAPLDDVADLLGTAYGRGAFLGQVHPDPTLREAGHRADALIQQWSVAMVFRDDLFAAVSAYAATDDAAGLTGERARMLTHVQRDLRHAGHELAPAARERLRAITSRLVDVGIEFQRNLADHDDPLVLTTEDLAGMPAAYVEGLQPGDEDGTHLLTMAYPDVLPFMDESPRRDLRREVDRRFNTRAVEANRPLLEEAMHLRAEAAALFGVASWAHHRLEERMVGEPAVVEALYADLLPALTTAGEQDRERLRALLVAATGDPDAVLQRWDWRHHHQQLRREQHGIDSAQVAAHFPLEQTLDGMFDLTAEVFGLTYRAIDVPTWHHDVRSYEVADAATGATIATFHMDLFPREGTFGHAAAWSLVSGRRLPDGSYQQPVSAIVANFTKPTANAPSLLRHEEVETLFHEFGHILHQVLTTAELARFSGTSVQRDFVEAPSQIMEHWTWQPEVLARFARHHETGEVIPPDLVERMNAARNLDVALAKLRQVQFGTFDLAVHGPAAATLDLDRAASDAMALTLMPRPDDTFWPSSFAHIIGGYDAGYYGYLWAEVIGDAMFDRFEREGITSSEVGADYRAMILEPGGTADASELVERFLGHPPAREPFLRKLGITATE